MTDPTFTPSPIRYRVWDGHEMWYPGDDDDEPYLATADGGVKVYGRFRDPRLESDNNSIPLLSTGLPDADGREVFDGDIVESIGSTSSTPLLVESAGPGRGFLLRLLVNGKRSTRHPNMFMIDWLPGYRVVGNVFEGISADR